MDAASLWYALQTFIERNGWKLLGAAVVLHVARHKYREYAQRAHAQRALAAANGTSNAICAGSFPFSGARCMQRKCTAEKRLNLLIDPVRGALRALRIVVYPSRVAVLQRETARIREAQQTRLAQTQAPTKKKK
ncbi:hypothetical protein FI667_g9547, partial [Globisporangium splendens]